MYFFKNTAGNWIIGPEPTSLKSKVASELRRDAPTVVTVRTIETRVLLIDRMEVTTIKKNAEGDFYASYAEFLTAVSDFFDNAPITAEEVDAKIGAEVDTLSDRIDTVEGIANAASSGSLGSIKPTDAAPTPQRNGNYTFSIGGNKPAWLTAEAGVTTVKAGDGVSVVYTAPSSYTYTHVDMSSALKYQSLNLHGDPHFNFILPTEAQKDVVNDYLFADVTPIVLGNNTGSKYNISTASGNDRKLKIRASQLKKWGINSGEYISVALNIKAESISSPSNVIYVWGTGYSTIVITDTNWKLITTNKQVTYSSDSDIIDLLNIAVDNTHSSGCRYLFIDGLTIVKAHDSVTKLSKTLEPKEQNKLNVGKNIIADYDLMLSPKYTRFLTANTETATLTKTLGTSVYGAITKNSINAESTTNQSFYFQQDVLISNVNRVSSFRRGIRLKISILESSVQEYTEATIMMSRYKSSWNTELPLSINFKLGEWVDILSPNYTLDKPDDYIHWSYRIELPSGKYKLEIINPTICEIGEDIFDFEITDNSRMFLPLLGKKWTSLGDSLTDGGGWQLYVQELTGAFPYIRGVGASQIIGDLFPTWINPSTKEHITNVLYAGYPTNLDPTTLNNYDSNCVTFKGMFRYTYDRDGIIPDPQTGYYIWWSNGALTPTWVRQYYNGSAWITLTDLVVDPNEGVLYTTINGRISSQNRVDTIPLDSDIVTIMAGTNDNGTVGAIDDYDNGTFIGYYRKMLDDIYNRCPKAKVIICLFPKIGTEYNSSTHVLTVQGVLKQSYRDALRNLCEKYGYSLIDMQPASNFQNMSQWLDVDLVHPTSEGHKYWAKIFSQQLN